jgi:WD40 repeat protein
MRTLLVLSALLLGACNSQPSERSLAENVGLAFAECNPSEIKFLASKHNFSPVFKYCGSNKIKQFSWSPEGTHIYFELTLDHHIMHAAAENRATSSVPTPLSPSGDVIWITPTRVAVPIARTDGDESIVIYDYEQASTFETAVPGYTDIDNLFSGANNSEVLFSATHKGTNGLFLFNIDTGDIEPAFTWLTTPFDTIDFQSNANQVAIGHDNRVTLYDAQTGDQKGNWTPAKRGIIHPEGKWLMLEHAGEEISVFGQRAWDEISENARIREQKRLKAYEKTLPGSYPTRVQPPTLSLVNLDDGNRWGFSAFYGDQFEWYGAVDGYISFALWGFEGKQLHRNIMVGNMTDRMQSIKRGEEMMGVYKMVSPDE